MPEDIIDVKAALKLKGFSFRVLSQVMGRKPGIHKSTHKGVSPDFLEYKEYSEGDELKHIDWRLYGRLDRLYVRKFEDEVNLSWCILIDTSGSMGYGQDGHTKLDYAKRLSATLSYLLLKQGDAVGVADFSDSEIDILSSRSGNSNINRIVEKLKGLDASGKTAIKEPSLMAVEKIKTDSAFVIVSDFFTDLDSTEEAFKLLRSARKEVFAFHVLDPDEINFNFNGSIEFEDMEDETKVLVDAESIKETYQKKMSAFILRLKQICQENRAQYIFSPTSLPIEDSLIQIAAK